jgi:uncharacterized protein YacL
MKNAIFVILIVVLASCIGWLISAGFFWMLQELANSAFGTRYDVNVWLGGLMMYILYHFFKK